MASGNQSFPKGQVYLALIVAVLFAAVATVVAMTNPAVRAAIARSSVSATTPTPDLTDDPRVGKLLAIPNADAFGRKIKLSARTLLVYAGPCTECTTRSFKPEEIKGQFDSMVVVFDADPKLIPQHYADLGMDIRIIADPKSELAAVLNAQWFPRFYLIDVESKLINIQSDPARLPDYVERLTPR